MTLNTEHTTSTDGRVPADLQTEIRVATRVARLAYQFAGEAQDWYLDISRRYCALGARVTINQTDADGDHDWDLMRVCGLQELMVILDAIGQRCGDSYPNPDDLRKYGLHDALLPGDRERMEGARS